MYKEVQGGTFVLYLLIFGRKWDLNVGRHLKNLLGNTTKLKCFNIKNSCNKNLTLWKAITSTFEKILISIYYINKSKLKDKPM